MRNGYITCPGLYIDPFQKHAVFLGELRVTDLGTHQCCILATQGKIINANHVPITHWTTNSSSRHLFCCCSYWIFLATVCKSSNVPPVSETGCQMPVGFELFWNGLALEMDTKVLFMFTHFFCTPGESYRQLKNIKRPNYPIYIIPITTTHLPESQISISFFFFLLYSLPFLT